MRWRSRVTVVLAAFVGVLALAAVASALFVVQGGFGRGDGRFDQLIGILGLPWMLILVVVPWPESLWLGDYMMIVLLPLVLNLCCVLGLWLVLRRRR